MKVFLGFGTAGRLAIVTRRVTEDVLRRWLASHGDRERGIVIALGNDESRDAMGRMRGQNRCEKSTEFQERPDNRKDVDLTLDERCQQSLCTFVEEQYNMLALQ